MTKPTDPQAVVLVLETKIRRPSVSSLLVARPRLLDQLTAWLDRRLILVSAPAGYGKTALTSQWLDSVGDAHAWLSLDEQDNDLATFLLYLVAAIRTVCHDAMGATELLARAPTLLAPSQLADALLQDMAGLPGPLILALDDCHAIKAPEVHQLMARLVEHLPSHVHLVLITRADPPLPLDRLRGRQQLGEIRAADLCFSSEETLLLLQQVLGPGVTEETAALLEDSTEGWAVGLHLAALSLRNRSDPAAFARRIAEHGHLAVTEYLLSEVLARLREAERDCLLQTSLFDRFCAPLIDAVQAEEGVKLSGEDFVRASQRANLFVVSLDDEGTWFRYHHFFQSLLRARLRQRYTDAEIKVLHARASTWFTAQGLVDEAVIHALKAGDPVGAARLVEEQVHPALDREDWRQIEHWIGLLPAKVSSGRPRLLVAQGWLDYIRWQFGAIEARLDAAEAAIQDAAVVERDAETTVRGEISAMRAALAQNKGDARVTVQWSEAAIAALRPQTGYAIGVAHFNHIWGLQACGEYEKAVEIAYSQLDASGWQLHALNLRVLLALANVHHEMANLPPLLDILPTWRKLAMQEGVGLSVGWSQYAEGWLHYQRNELEAAEESFTRFGDVAWGAHGRAVVDGYTGLVLTALARGRLDEASAHISTLNERLLERGMVALVNITQSLAQRVALAGGSLSSLDWRPDPSSAAISIDLWEQPMLTHARTLLTGGSPDRLVRASELLADSQAKALARNSNRRLIEIGGLKALVLSTQGDEAAAVAALQEAVERAAPGGALRLLVDCGPGLIPLLQKLQSRGVAPRYVQRVLAAFHEPAVVPVVPSTQPGAVVSAAGQEIATELLTNREIDVLALLAERLPDKEIADRLVLSPLTVKKHTQRIYRKLGVANRRAAVAQARRLGLV